MFNESDYLLNQIESEYELAKAYCAHKTANEDPSVNQHKSLIIDRDKLGLLNIEKKKRNEVIAYISGINTFNCSKIVLSSEQYSHVRNIIMLKNIELSQWFSAEKQDFENSIKQIEREKNSFKSKHSDAAASLSLFDNKISRIKLEKEYLNNPLTFSDLPRHACIQAKKLNDNISIIGIAPLMLIPCSAIMGLLAFAYKNYNPQPYSDKPDPINFTQTIGEFFLISMLLLPAVLSPYLIIKYVAKYKETLVDNNPTTVDNHTTTNQM